MKPSKRIVWALFALFFGLAGGYSSVQAQSSKQVFDRLQRKYDGISTLRAAFSQTMTSEYSDGASSSSGVLFLEGDKYRVETKAQTFVTDGKVTWVYLPTDNQVLINDYVADESTFSLSEFFQNYDERYQVSAAGTRQIDGQKHHVLTLKPKSSESFFKHVTLSMRDRDDVVTKLEVLDVNGTTMVFNLTNIELNPRLDGTTFSFTPPKGVEVIDLRS